MQQWFKRYYYASSGMDYQEIINNGYKFKEIDIGMYCDPIILPLCQWSFEKQYFWSQKNQQFWP